MKRVFKSILIFVMALMVFAKVSNVYAKEITVYFDTDGGTVIPSVTLDGESLSQAGKIPDDPEKDGFTFIGWYRSTEYLSWQQYGFHEIFDEDTTYYARFIANDKFITNIAVEVDAPIAGTEITVTVDTSQGALIESQNEVPVARVVGDNPHFEISFTAWVDGNCDEYGICDTRFEGTFVKDQVYYADMTIEVEDGYYLADKLTVTINGEPAHCVYSENPGTWTMFVGAVTAVEDPMANVKIEAEDADNSQDDDAKVEVIELITSVVNNQEVDGIDEELAAQIVNAINNNKTIVVDVETAVVPKDNVAADATKIENTLESTEKVGAYFDIGVVLKVDDASIGNVTELNNTITITVDLPNNLPPVPAGYTRVYKIVRVHAGGDPEELAATVNGDKVSFDADKFSTYALVYQDVANSSNPDTFDGIVLYILMLGFSIIGFVGTSFYLRKRIN